uniref:Uncharacterized protein n=1 Tax=Anguilla anguilla TaxID=7936 RepID=A0A0E9XH66_ANGAN
MHIESRYLLHPQLAKCQSKCCASTGCSYSYETIFVSFFFFSCFDYLFRRLPSSMFILQ